VKLPTTPARESGGLLRELGAGWTYFHSTPWIWTGTAVFTVINPIQIGVWQVLGPVIADQTIGAGRGGVVLSVRAAGLLLMSLLMTGLTVRRPFVAGMSWLAVSAAPLILLGVRANAVLLAAAALLAGIAAAVPVVVGGSGGEDRAHPCPAGRGVRVRADGGVPQHLGGEPQPLDPFEHLG
jgi:hypothetical protein